MTAENKFRLAVPGKGALEAATLAFLTECGMKVNRSNPRQYLARIDSLPDLEVVFQRATDIPSLVQDGSMMLGITGYDILAEHRGNGDEETDGDDNDDELIVLERDLGYGHCRLVVAVPEEWIDVSNCADLWHLAGYYQTHKLRGLHIATKYPALTEHFLRKHGIARYKLVTPHGAIEAAPLTDTADLIVDLTETGTTLRENHLKLLDDGEVLRSQACLIANTHLLRNEQAQLVTSMVLELIEARMQARKHSLLTAYMQSESEDEKNRLCARLYQRLKSLVSSGEFQVSGSELGGNAKMHSYTISCVINIGSSASELLEIMAIFRSAGAVRIDTTPLQHRFAGESISVRALRERLRRIR